MQWVAPSEKDVSLDTLEKRLWSAADQLRANSGLSSAQYSQPVLGLIFLRFAEVRFAALRAKLEKTGASSRRGSRVDDPTAYHAEGVLYLTPSARFPYLLALPEKENVGKRINEAMADIEKHNSQLAGVLPRTYEIFNSALLKDLLKRVSEIPADLEGDTFGKVYEYFLGAFAMSEGQQGGEFFTPTSIVRLLVEVIEPFHGRILDPACGSGGMFVQSARFVSEHRKRPSDEIAICGQEKVDATVRLCRMNLAVHGLEGDIKQGITYYDDLHGSVGAFDFVLANPPFNVGAVDKERLTKETGPGKRYPFGLPRVDSANYLWIELFYSSLNSTGRAGFVMANSAADARNSEMEIRKQVIQSGAVEAIVAVGSNFFYTVTLACTLWFFDKGKASPGNATRLSGNGHKPPASIRNPQSEIRNEEVRNEEVRNEVAPNRQASVLFIDARHIYRQIDRAHRDWTPAQLSFLANIVRLYRGEAPDYTLGGQETEAKLREVFSPTSPQSELRNREGSSSQSNPQSAICNPQYRDIPGLCKAATISEIEQQAWSLNPGRYVGVAPGEDMSDEDFKEKLQELNEEFEKLTAEAHRIEKIIAANVAELLE